MTEWVEKKLKDRLGLSVKEVADPLKALKDEAAKLEIEGRMATNRMKIRKDRQESQVESSTSNSKSNKSNDDDDVLKGTVFANMPASNIDSSAVKRGKEYIREWEP